ncbi:hypothetical protein F5X68DRAFT_66609 [Plectosphaerella plurivora]|uniref:Uncharacterized protein n=1 Tax=Plectosphaerella plurivora TaxID=936078 RepID=A0A9P9AAW0_9PEZI|nr:hypothetical protein F5X68DRAFT_66609 [Plectosphaerella plurivora]
MTCPASSDRGANNVMSYITHTSTLVDSFNALADEVQSLTDRNTILEHKLRFAHEQYQYLADRHAPAVPEISETLAKLQLPPDLNRQDVIEDQNAVPLPKRSSRLDSRNQIALLIRDGRRSAQHLAALVEPSKTSASSRGSLSHKTRSDTSMSTALEQDFTVEGRKGQLQCPFSAAASPAPVAEDADGGPLNTVEAGDPTPHHSTDPICAAMYEETTSQPAPGANGSASKCPIRYLDQHSPEEIAHYVETHKHELPRSHAVCVGRYQKNEDQIRKLDAKYGNLVSMIQGLSNLHKPMLPLAEQEQDHDQQNVDKASNERVESWARAVTSSLSGEEAGETTALDDERSTQEERESHFDRPLKEVRVGESPSRPWGISVPVYHQSDDIEGIHGPPLSPPPAPVVMPGATSDEATPAKPRGKCPFDHTKMAAMQGLQSPLAAKAHPDKASVMLDHTAPHHPPSISAAKAEREKAPPPPFTLPQQPAFINPPAEAAKPAPGIPQMVFTGPVFIGYPMDQAIQFMQQFQGRQ